MGVAFLLQFYVVMKIATFDSTHGSAMDFILGVVGATGMMGFDDDLVGYPPLWGIWYQQHTYWHPQGAHPDGCFVDDALSLTPEGQEPEDVVKNFKIRRMSFEAVSKHERE